jgi:hypothetical protein
MILRTQLSTSFLLKEDPQEKLYISLATVNYVSDWFLYIMLATKNITIISQLLANYIGYDMHFRFRY